MVQLHNPTNQSRLCVKLGRNLEAFEVLDMMDVPEGFEKCDTCSCVVWGSPEAPAPSDS